VTAGVMKITSSRGVLQFIAVCCNCRIEFFSGRNAHEKIVTNHLSADME